MPRIKGQKGRWLAIKKHFIMGLILWIIFGGLVGWVASMITGTPQGLIVDIIVGIIGAVIGGWIMAMLGQGGITGFNLYSFVVAVIGAIVLVVIVRAIRGAGI